MNAPESLDFHNKQIADAYNARPYDSKAFWYSSPGHLRAVCHLYGVETVPLKHARVLELGCAAGGNLLPFALTHPEAEVVGIDLSPVQIEHGKKVIRDLGLKNLRLEAMDLTTVTPDFGQFDYIIAHGVFSWVPPEVKQAIMRICRENLSAKGVAYVSYNTYPGWKAGDVVRDAMMLHSYGAESDSEKLGRAKAMLSLLTNGLAVGNRIGAGVRHIAQDLTKNHSDFYIAHEYLEYFNTPCYLVEFADIAAQAGLAYVGDTEAHTELPAAYGDNVQLHLNLIALGQPKVMRQQYLDFAVGRNFRKSLLVHQERAGEISMMPDVSLLKDLRLAGHFTRHADDEAAGGTLYRGQRGRDIRTDNPVMEALIKVLSDAWPTSLDFYSLAKKVGMALKKTHADAPAEEAILKPLNALFSTGNTLHIALEGDAYTERSKGPLGATEGYAYVHARRREDMSFGVDCFNLWHDAVTIRMSECQAWILPALDGEPDLKQVLAKLIDGWQRGTVPGPNGESLTGKRNLETLARKTIKSLTDTMRRVGVLHGK